MVRIKNAPNKLLLPGTIYSNINNSRSSPKSNSLRSVRGSPRSILSSPVLRSPRSNRSSLRSVSSSPKSNRSSLRSNRSSPRSNHGSPNSVLSSLSSITDYEIDENDDDDVEIDENKLLEDMMKKNDANRKMRRDDFYSRWDKHNRPPPMIDPSLFKSTDIPHDNLPVINNTSNNNNNNSSIKNYSVVNETDDLIHIISHATNILKKQNRNKVESSIDKVFNSNVKHNLLKIIDNYNSNQQTNNNSNQQTNNNLNELIEEEDDDEDILNFDELGENNEDDALFEGEVDDDYEEDHQKTLSKFLEVIDIILREITPEMNDQIDMVIDILADEFELYYNYKEGFIRKAHKIVYDDSLTDEERKIKTKELFDEYGNKNEYFVLFSPNEKSFEVVMEHFDEILDMDPVTPDKLGEVLQQITRGLKAASAEDKIIYEKRIKKHQKLNKHNAYCVIGKSKKGKDKCIRDFNAKQHDDKCEISNKGRCVLKPNKNKQSQKKINKNKINNKVNKKDMYCVIGKSKKNRDVCVRDKNATQHDSQCSISPKGRCILLNRIKKTSSRKKKKQLKNEK